MEKATATVLTINGAAKRYEGTALTAHAIRQLVRSGEIPSRRIGTKYLVCIDAIEAWLQAAPQAKEREHNA